MPWARWYRITEEGACDWCLMLATRGAVYHTEDTAMAETDTWHDHCHCSADMEVDQSRADIIHISPADAERIVEVRPESSPGSMYRYPMNLWLNGAPPPNIQLELFPAPKFSITPPTPLPSGARGRLDELPTEWAPGRWTRLTGDEVYDLVQPQPGSYQESLYRYLRTKGAHPDFDPSRIRDAYVNGPHRIVIENTLTSAQKAGLLKDADWALGKLPADVKAESVTIRVPVGDKHFKSGNVGGYVTRGTRTINLYPKIAKGDPEWGMDSANSGHFMPYFRELKNPRRAVLIHEQGHVVDNIHNDLYPPPVPQPDGSLKLNFHTFPWHRDFYEYTMNEKYPLDRSQWDYARKNPSEAYAEMYANFKTKPPVAPLGSPFRNGDSAAEDAAKDYALRYVWK